MTTGMTQEGNNKDVPFQLPRPLFCDDCGALVENSQRGHTKHTEFHKALSWAVTALFNATGIPIPKEAPNA